MEICSPTGLGACRRPVCCHWGALPVPAGRLLVALLSALERFVSLATHDRIAVLDAYSRRCAITGERSLSVIEASHIQLFARGGQHAVRNGLPLRPDIHRLFDLGYVGVRPNHSFAVSPALRDQYENGRVSTTLTVAQMPRDAVPCEGFVIPLARRIGQRSVGNTMADERSSELVQIVTVYPGRPLCRAAQPLVLGVEYGSLTALAVEDQKIGLEAAHADARVGF